jgi:PAS domain-containing protein
MSDFFLFWLLKVGREGNMVGNETVSDNIYHDLFNKMTNALSYTEIVLDNRGKPCDLRLLDVNPAMVKLMDIPKSKIVGRTCTELNLLIEQESTALLQDIKIAIRFGNSYQSRLFCSSLNKWLEVTLFFIGADYYGLLLTDITQREEAEKALRDSVEKYHTLFKKMDEGLAIFEMIFNAEGKPVDQLYLEMNEAFCEQTKYSVVEGELVRDLIPNASEHWFETYGEVALTGKPVRFEKESKVLNRWYEVFAFKIGGPDSREVATLFKDITERKKAEERLIFQANMLSCVNDAILAADENGKFTYWNEIAEKIFGWSSQEAIGHTIDELFPSNTSKIKVSMDCTNILFHFN